MEYNKMNDVIQEYVKKTTDRQNQIVREKLFEYLGEEIDLVEEGKKIFPRIAIVRDSKGNTTYYWNDGNVTPKRIVTFVWEEPQLNSDVYKNTYTMNYTYF